MNDAQLQFNSIQFKNTLLIPEGKLNTFFVHSKFVVFTMHYIAYYNISRYGFELKSIQSDQYLMSADMLIQLICI